jgi:hypothetical protein
LDRTGRSSRRPFHFKFSESKSEEADFSVESELTSIVDASNAVSPEIFLSRYDKPRNYQKEFLSRKKFVPRQIKVAPVSNHHHMTRSVRPFTFTFILCSVFLGASLMTVGAADVQPSKTKFFSYRDAAGKTTSARIIYHYRRVQIVHPLARVDSRLDPKLMRAASIADERAYAHSKARCWHYVKEALVAAGAVTSYPRTAYACQAGQELVRDYGFKKLSVRDPYDAPLGAVLVYGHGSNGAGHVEIRTRNGFVSDYSSKNRCRYPLLAAYGKFFL